MQNENCKAVDAIWKTDLKDGNEKLVLYQLVSKHELGERYSSSWKSIDQFLEDFQPKWCTIKEIMEGTQLSQVKVQRTLQALSSRKLVDSSEIPVKLKKKQVDTGEMQAVYAITQKIFADFAGIQDQKQVASA